tara:strand:- start:23692 stop:24099 length:408 start_codon:yes stop_codon:yes gene_type:complete
MTKAELQNLLSTVKTIALVGASLKTHRPSYEVMHFLQNKGFKVYPVNPVLAGQSILNEKVYASLKELPVNVDMVDIFRNSEAAGETCNEVLALPKEKQAQIVWMQIGVINEEAARLLQEHNLTVIMNECPKQVLS